MSGEPRERPRLAPTTAHALRKSVEALADTGWSTEAERIRDRVQSGAPQRPLLVLAGELGRGKSTLTNALLGQPEVSPTGRGGVTAVPIQFAPTSTDRSEGQTFVLYHDGDVEEIDRTELSQRVRLDPQRRQDEHQVPPRQLLSVINGRWFPEMTIIDTPGAGGQNPTLARAAMAAADDAGVLVVVTDAAGRLTAPAIDFIRQCASGIDHIIVVLNMIDANRAWPAIADENRELLGQHLPQAQVQVLGVSALRAVTSYDEQDPTRRERLFQASGLPTLIERIGEIFAQDASERTARSLASLDALLNTAHRQAQDRLAAATTDPAPQDSPKERLKALGEAQKRAERNFARDSQDLWDGLNDRTQHTQFTLNNRWTDRLTETPLFGLPETERVRTLNEFTAELDLALQEVVDDSIDGATEITRRLFSDAGIACPPSLIDLVSRPPEIIYSPPQPRANASAAEKGRGTMRGAMMGAMAGRLTPWGVGMVIGGIGGAIGGAAMIERLEAPKLLREAITRTLTESVMNLRRDLSTRAKVLRYDVLDEFHGSCQAEGRRLRDLGEQASRAAAERTRDSNAAKTQMSELHAARKLLGAELQRLE